MPEVEEIPVNVVVLSDLPTGVPTALVAEIPVSPITSAGVMVPIEEANEIPVKVTVQSDRATTVPKEEVAEIPVSPICCSGITG